MSNNIAFWGWQKDENKMKYTLTIIYCVFTIFLSNIVDINKITAADSYAANTYTITLADFSKIYAPQQNYPYGYYWLKPYADYAILFDESIKVNGKNWRILFCGDKKKNEVQSVCLINPTEKLPGAEGDFTIPPRIKEAIVHSDKNVLEVITEERHSKVNEYGVEVGYQAIRSYIIDGKGGDAFIDLLAGGSQYKNRTGINVSHVENKTYKSFVGMEYYPYGYLAFHDEFNFFFYEFPFMLIDEPILVDGKSWRIIFPVSKFTKEVDGVYLVDPTKKPPRYPGYFSEFPPKILEAIVHADKNVLEVVTEERFTERHQYYTRIKSYIIDGVGGDDFINLLVGEALFRYIKNETGIKVSQVENTPYRQEEVKPL